MLRWLHCAEIEQTTSEQRNQQTHNHLRSDGITTYTAYQHHIKHKTVLSIFYILTQILNYYLKLNILYL